MTLASFLAGVCLVLGAFALFVAILVIRSGRKPQGFD